MLALVVGVVWEASWRGIWSAGRVESRIVPLGAIGIVVMSVGLLSAGTSGRKATSPHRLFSDARRAAPPGTPRAVLRRASCSTAVRGNPRNLTGRQ
jgi:hypothetical protein